MVQGTRHLDTPRTEFTICFLNVLGGHCNKIPPDAPVTKR